jgi:pyrroline-5-carboxylate reductase
MLKIGFIGAGNMANAMIAGIKKTHPTAQLYAIDPNQSKLQAIAQRYHVEPCSSLLSMVKASHYIVVAVKPQSYDTVLAELKPHLEAQQIVITIAVGYLLSRAANYLGHQTKIIRSMPNTPALVGAGMSAIAVNKNITDKEKKQSQIIFSSFGKVLLLDEKYFDIFSAISSSLPAYICIIIEALSDAAVQHGLPRTQSYQVISQAILGSAKWIQESDQHPAVLKDQVCSPNGTTIAAIAALEKNGLRNTLINAVNACMARTKELK